MLNITVKDKILINNETALYARILAFNKDSKELLSVLNKSSKIPVLTQINDTVLSNLNKYQGHLFKYDILATNIYNIIINNSLNNDYYNKL